MVNRTEAPRGVSSNLLTGGPEQLHFEGIERAAEKVVQPKSLIPKNEITDRFARSQPRLFPNYTGIRYIRFTGELLIQQWDRTKPQVKGQKSLHTGDREEPSQRKWPKRKSIETAIGGAIHIIENYRQIDSGEGKDIILAKVEKVREFTEDMYRRFSSGEIEEDNIQSFYETAYDLFSKSGLLRARVPNKKTAVEQVLKALERDKIFRFNPTVSRMRLASATSKWFVELFIGDLVVEKYQNQLSALIQERGLERFYLEQVLQQVNSFMNLDPNDPFVQEEKENLLDTVLECFRHNTIKVAPYRIPALRFLFSAFGLHGSKPTGNKSLYYFMFGPDSQDPISDIEQINQDFSSLNPEAQIRFRNRLKDGTALLEKTLKGGGTKYGEYSESIQRTLGTNGIV